MSKYDSPSKDAHRSAAPTKLACAVVTVSDTRTLADDPSGDLIESLVLDAGHRVVERRLTPDEPEAVARLVRQLVDARHDAVLITGGTGVAPRDQTPEAIAGLFTKPLPGYGELFRWLSYQEIGAAAMLSRACGGIVDQTAVFLMPGSTAAVRLAIEQLILPELGHIVGLCRG